MSRKNSKQLVLDASLSMGRNPGDRNRRCLLAIRKERHVAVFNLKLRREWRDHASPFAIRWLQAMEQKNLVRDEEGEQHSGLLIPARSCLVSDVHKVAFAKDFHLIQSALETGQLILSNEKEFPRFVAPACSSVKELLQLHYANPMIEGDQCILWLKGGAEKDADRRIDLWVRNHFTQT